MIELGKEVDFMKRWIGMLLIACVLPLFIFSCHAESSVTGELNDAVPMRAEMDGMIFDYDTVIDGVFFKDDILIHYPASKTESSYQIPEGTVGIHHDAFLRASEYLSDLLIPASCETIGIDDPLNHSPGEYNPDFAYRRVKNFIVNEDNPYFSSRDGVLFTFDQSVLLLYSCNREETIYTVPQGVKEIEDDAFRHNRCLTVYFPESLLFIGDYAFYNSNLEFIAFPEGLWKIGIDAFAQCVNLRHVTFPDSLLEIGAGAFEACGLEDVTLPPNLKRIGTETFYGVEIEETTEIKLPASLECIGKNIFEFGYSSEDYWSPIYLVYDASPAMKWAITHRYHYRIIE